MPRRIWVAVLLLAAWSGGRAEAASIRPDCWRSVESLNSTLCGQVLDFTHNHRGDRRICAPSLCEKRDLYIYLPPCYDPNKKYPAMLYLHGIAQDEVSFLHLVPLIDKAMACGQLPPMIIAAPDGTTRGNPSIFNAGSFYINSRAGNFEDYIVHDIWGFVCNNYSVRPEPEYHVLCGPSMGGFGAFNLGIKYRDTFKIVAGVFPPLHLRYLDCHGRYFANYDPCCLGLRERLAPARPVAHFYGVITVHERTLSQPLFGCFNKEAIQQIAAENPYEMLDAYDLKPGELEMFVGYGKRDEFNIDAQVEAFVDKARCRGLEITCVCDPKGRHDTATGIRIFPNFCAWLTLRLPDPVK